MLKQRVSTSETISGADTYYWKSTSGSSETYPSNSWNYQTSYESMLDENSGKYGRTNNCTHVKWDQTYRNTLYAYRTDSDRSTPSSYIDVKARLLRWFTYQQVEGNTNDTIDRFFGQAYPGLNPLNVTWRDLYARALQSMWPKIEKQFDETIANSAYESPQILSLFLNTSSRVKKVASLLQQNGKAGLALMTALGSKKFIANKGEWLRLVMGSTARADLTWEFGLRPLIQDIMVIHNSMKRVRQDLRRLVSNQNRVLRSHWSTNLTPPALLEDRSRVYNLGNVPIQPDERCTYIMNAYILLAKYTASLKYSYTIREGALRHSQLTAFLDAYGIGGFGDPQMLWNAIPFSFVVDYFAHVGNFLHQFSDRGIQPSVNILDSSHSLTWKYTRTLDLKVQSITGTSTTNEHVRNYSFYQRERPAPNQVSQIALRGFSKRNVRYLGTLYAAMKL